MKNQFDTARVREWRDLKEKLRQCETEMCQEYMSRVKLKSGQLLTLKRGAKLTYRLDSVRITTIAGYPVPVLMCHRYYKTTGSHAGSVTVIWPSDVEWGKELING